MATRHPARFAHGRLLRSAVQPAAEHGAGRLRRNRACQRQVRKDHSGLVSEQSIGFVQVPPVGQHHLQHPSRKTGVGDWADNGRAPRDRPLGGEAPREPDSRLRGIGPEPRDGLCVVAHCH